MDMLTDEEVARFTGLVRPSAQKRWFDGNGITSFINAEGRCVTTWHNINSAGSLRPKNDDLEPDFSSLGSGHG